MTWLKKVASLVGQPAAVCELGSFDVNGSPRKLWGGASRYVGVDVRPGRGVDVVADAADWGSAEEFDLVVSTEVLEHTPRAEDICHNAHRLLRSGGTFILTAAGPGREPHSAVDGMVLRPGEFYRNVSPDELRVWLSPFSAVLVETRDEGTLRAVDVYALARKEG